MKAKSTISVLYFRSYVFKARRKSMYVPLYRNPRNKQKRLTSMFKNYLPCGTAPKIIFPLPLYTALENQKAVVA